MCPNKEMSLREDSKSGLWGTVCIGNNVSPVILALRFQAGRRAVTSSVHCLPLGMVRQSKRNALFSIGPGSSQLPALCTSLPLRPGWRAASSAAESGTMLPPPHGAAGLNLAFYNLSLFHSNRSAPRRYLLFSKQTHPHINSAR